MEFELTKIDWNAISAISTLAAVLVALFYQPFLNRRKISIEPSLVTSDDNTHLIYLNIINRSEKPLWIISGGILYQDEEKRVACFLDKGVLPKKLEPSEHLTLPRPILEYNFKIKDAFAKDSLGKFWKLSRANRKNLEQYIQICLDNNPPIVRANGEYIAKPKIKNKNNQGHPSWLNLFKRRR